MDKVIQLISLCKDINSLVDRGHVLEIKAFYKALEKKKFFEGLKQEYRKQINIDVFTKKDTVEIEKQFLKYSISYQPEELGVESNALNLLIAYCLMLIDTYLK